ncbi:RNAPII degradation factor [Friedmanniomyces endolithicus]|nr:RNAPII degradation factor [Friedmanniomyces endolithicus]KAK0955568.1 RNAPII degradation factor [Friedmanniomyces endolithicus]KAK1037133.1 RNAPII degradation factor [Friedmanniomyces endolithicus]
MSELEARPPPSTRGRSAIRGGRGGFGRGGPRGSRKPVNGTADTAGVDEPLEDQGEIGEMKRKYAQELSMLRDMFPEWTDVDLVFALQEADGDVGATVEKITQGSVSQFAEVKKPKDRARSKVKEESAMAGANDRSSARGGRGRGSFEGARGGRGRATDRGRGGFRGGRGGHATTNGTPKDGAASIATTESTAWDTPATVDASTNGGWDSVGADSGTEVPTAQGSWDNVSATEAPPATAPESTMSSLIPDGVKKSWASMFSQPKPTPAAPSAKQAPLSSQSPPAEFQASGEVPLPSEDSSEVMDQPEPEIDLKPGLPTIEEPLTEPLHEPSPMGPSAGEGEELALAPSQDPLTEENVEHLPDESSAPATQTVASTIGSTDTRNLTPLPNHQPAPIGTRRPPLGGYATSAYRATGVPGRSASYQRRVQEQQEAVVMPGHNAVDRAAVQFGSMGLNSDAGSDVDEDREEPETQQALQHSPPSQPRTSLPPPPRQPQETARPEGLPTPKQAPGLPPASQQNQQQMQDATMAAGLTQDPAQMNPSYNQYARYGQPGIQQQDSGASQQKPYDPFSQQAQHSQYDQYGTQQAHQQQQPQQQPQSTHSGFGGLSSAPNDYQSYYTSNEQQRNAYNQYYGGSYGPQDARSQMGQGSQQDVGLGQQRSTSGFGVGSDESAYNTQAQQQAHSRFGEAPGSGNNTPNPLLSSQQQHTAPVQQAQQHSMQQGPTNHQQQQPQQPQPQQQQQGGYGQSAGYPYGHPYYQSPYQQAYAAQHGAYNSYQQPGGYGAGGGYPSKQQQQGNMYGAPGGYGMGSQSSFDQHSSSPANASALGQNQQQSSMRSASGMSSGLGGGLDDYGRSSAQSASHQSSAFGGMNDPFARSASGFGGQSGYGQQGMGGQEDSLKPYNESKTGPSPSLGQPGRPGSAANSASALQSGMPQQQQPSQQAAAYGGYPGFPGQQGGSQYGGLGGLGSHQQQQQVQSGGMGGGQGGYGGYGAGGFSQTYGAGYGSRGGWGSNYGAH